MQGGWEQFPDGRATGRAVFLDVLAFPQHAAGWSSRGRWNFSCVLSSGEPPMTAGTTTVRAAFMAFLFVGLFHLASSAQMTGPPNRRLVIASMYGPDLFQFYCATCHGRDGKGAGPVVPTLRVVPPDLTTIALRNGGTFPKERVEALVAGGGDSPAIAHGSKEMPVWGPIFQALDPNDRMTSIRIANIVNYLESMQRAK